MLIFPTLTYSWKLARGVESFIRSSRGVQIHPRKLPMTKYRLRSRSLYSLLGFVVISLSAAAQTSATNQWTWIGGSQSPDQIGVPGYIGVPSPTTIPTGLSGASTWTDANGNLWLFGGAGLLVLYINPSTSAVALLNDMWEYNPSTNQWTWMGGNLSAEIGTILTGDQGTSPGVYGMLGVPAAANTPGSRYDAMAWTDKAGNFWLYGGSGFDANGTHGFLNDIWKFNSSTMQWTWMGGSSTVPGYFSGLPGVYGVLGTPAAGNTPGGRYDAATWTDFSGNFWLFGGWGLVSNPGASYISQGPLNDLWEFNPSTGQWAWMGGSMPADCNGLTCPQSGVYGTLGTPAAGNVPGSRYLASSWTDSSGNFWLFGGNKCPAANDLWEFNPKTQIWAWMGGSVYQSTSNSCGGEPGFYGTLGTPAPENIPGSRGGAATWTDRNGDLWLFGGYGYDANGYPGSLDDIWEFNPAMNQWVWMGGSSAFVCPANSIYGPNCGQEPPAYGTLGTSGEANLPGSLSAPATWTGKSGDLWLFGGETSSYGYLNDLWRFQASSTTDFTVAATPVILPAVDTYNLPQSITITDTTPGAFIYYTTDGSTTPTTSSSVYSSAILVSATQTVQAIAVAPNYLNSEVATSTYTINIPSSPPQIISGLSPSEYLAGRLPFTLTVNGLRFTTGSVVYWGTSALSTSYFSPTQLTAQVSATDVASVGITPVTVQTPGASGGTSNTFQFEVDSSDSEPTDPALNPPTATVAAGSPASYKLTVPASVTGVSLSSCLNLPAGASCSYSSATNTLTIATSSTTLPGTYLVTVVCTETVVVAATSSILLPVLLLPLAFQKRKQRARRIWLANAFIALLFLAGAAFWTGCGGGGSTPTPPPTEQMTSSDVITLIVQ